MNKLAALDAHSDWEHARRETMLQDVVCVFKGCSVDLLSFNEVKDRLQLTQKVYRGRRTIKLEHIRGSVGRYHDFAAGFLPRNDSMRERWENVDVFVSTHGEPPIEVYLVGEAYFVMDGNHRVSVSRQLGRKMIDAEVWEYTSPVELSSEADHNELLIKGEHTNFLELSQIANSFPDHNIAFTSPKGYHSLVYQLEIYRKGLEQTLGERVSLEDACAQWYEEVYRPAVTAIRESGVLDQFPERTEADLFIWVWNNQEDLKDFSPYNLMEAFEGKKRTDRQPAAARVKEALGDVLATLFLRRY